MICEEIDIFFDKGVLRPLFACKLPLRLRRLDDNLLMCVDGMSWRKKALWFVGYGDDE